MINFVVTAVSNRVPCAIKLNKFQLVPEKLTESRQNIHLLLSKDNIQPHFFIAANGAGPGTATGCPSFLCI